MDDNKSKQLVSNGLRLDDNCTIIPYQGRRKKISLNRTCFEITLCPVDNIKKDGYKLSIPSLKNESAEFTLTLVSTQSDDLSSKYGRYHLKSTDNEVFKINGSFVFECILQRGDVVDLGYNRFIFNSGEMNKDQEIYEPQNTQFLESKLIKHDINILIEGETGTGKTRLAKLIHDKSLRVGSFVHINLSSFSPNLIESELFGHTKGAFTGANQNKLGAILEANYGTLFLDEIDSLPIDLQTKLLLFLESKMIRPVGGSHSVKVDTRLIFAAGRKLKNLVDDKIMRKDFYFRLISGGQIQLPSLEDKPDLVQFLCRDYMEKNNIYISKKLISFYENIKWPGNIRQLMGHLNKKKILTNGHRFDYDETDRDLINEEKDFSKGGFHDSFKPFSEIKKEYFKKVFMYYDGNYLLASRVLKICPQTLRTTLNHPASKE